MSGPDGLTLRVRADTSSNPRPREDGLLDNFTVTYSYDGAGNVKSRTDASGATRWDYGELNREKVRTLQNGAQTALAYTPAATSITAAGTDRHLGLHQGRLGPPGLPLKDVPAVVRGRFCTVGVWCGFRGN
ncbi:hypothetical protein ACFYSF_34995 [Streptomyces canus]|uniref:hypothetical protein n=1 Tax=Streptomyces canus TaxID=58343 RepID=UPI0036B90004